MAEKQASKTAGKPIRCSAAVAREMGKPLVMEEVIVSPPNPHEVRIRIICTSLCFTNIAFWKMKDPPGYFPRILGHEAVGAVKSVGEEVDEVTEGDIVLPIFLPYCGECRDCRSKKSNLCSKFPFEVAEGARLCGAKTIIGVDVNPDRYIYNRENFLESLNQTVSRVINEMTDGAADYCFECVGSGSIG